MHEFSIAESILRTALAEAEKRQSKRICSLRIRLGKASHIEPESLEFCIRVAAKGTIAKDARMEITPLELTAKCRKCGCIFIIRSTQRLCPGCDGENLEILTGSEVFLESLEVD